MPPNLGAAIGQGLRATVREPWLVPVGAVVAGARRALGWAAWGTLAAMLGRAALEAFAERPFDASAPVRGALAVLGAPRFVALVLGLWGAGLLLGAALRVAWLAGALPTLGGALSRAPREPRFAAGVAYGLPRVLAAAALGLVAELGAGLFGLTLALAALRVVAHATGARAPWALVAAAALALTVGAAAQLASGALADAAVARAAIRQEGPAEAFAGAVRRFLARPGTFLLAALAFGAAAAAAPLAVEGVGGVATGFARGVDPLVLLGPNLMMAVAAVFVAAAIDLWWLGTVASLACGED